MDNQGPVHLYRDYMTARYGEPLFRVPVDLGQGCPHRAGLDSGGCTFCPENGARAVQTQSVESVAEQVKAAVLFARNRYRAKKYMLYFQAFSATMNLDQGTRDLYRKLISERDYAAVSIGTRPDCLGDDVVSFLQELQRDTEVWVELGIQTVHDSTLQRINRGHDWVASERAVLRLHDAGIKVAAHVILGLPGEGEAETNETASVLADLPVDAVKVHNLHVIRGTALAEEYAAEPFAVYDEYDYAELLMSFLRYTPWDRPIIRMTTDTPQEDLVAPIWHMLKGAFREYVQQQMVCREWVQGDLCRIQESGFRIQDVEDSGFRKVSTEDGSVTFWNEDYKEHYHTPVGARLEAEQKYVVPSRLDQRLREGDVALLDICFGLGYNALSACQLAERLSRHQLNVTALEMDRRVVGQAAREVAGSMTNDDSWGSCLRNLHAEARWEGRYAKVNMLWGDARYRIRQLGKDAFNVVFLDAFSTQRNSELWTLDFFRLVRDVMAEDSVLVTYCAALPVRAGLLKAGFFIGETEPIGRKRSGTIAAMRREDIITPIPDAEWDAIRDTERGLPYRDPHLCWRNREILRERQELVVEWKKKH